MKKILCIKTHAIGDLLMVTPALRALHRALPDAGIHVLTGAWSAPVLKNNPNISGIIEFDDAIFFKRRFFKIVSLIVKVRKEKFDTAFIFHTSPLIHLFTLLAGIKNRIGLRRNGRGWFLTQAADETADNDYYYPGNFLKLLEKAAVFSSDYSLDMYYSENEIDRMTAIAHTKDIRLSDRIIILAPGGAYNPKESINARLWPKESYSRLIEKIHQAFPDITLLLVGAENDGSITAFLSRKNIPHLVDLTAQTTINDLAFLADRSMLIVCNDSSMLHIGMAMKKPVVCFFGPTALKSRVPPEMRSCCMQSPAHCSPCYRYAIFAGCRNAHQCMHALSPDSAFEKIESLLMKR